MPGFHAFIAMTISITNAWYKGKVHWYPHANKLLQKYAISNKAINIHSRGPTEQHFFVWEPDCGCLHKVKKVPWYPLIKEGQRSHNIGKWSRTPIYYTTPLVDFDQNSKSC